MVAFKSVLVLLVALVCMVVAMPDGYKQEQLARVKMQVYRGPTKGKGYDTFAPWGFYVQQPEDYKGYHH
ncbi:hypothetical protein Hamer_G023223 [Homarus americanus]|uniref:Uncharacterized protein n=1 Tax=Homarus americanus TaxID=6706 RepID=A0A8J5ML46_HOMAM|nr:hypothetical protein Hamer_G023223 [Homarus americanus]